MITISAYKCKVARHILSISPEHVH